MGLDTGQLFRTGQMPARLILPPRVGKGTEMWLQVGNGLRLSRPTQESGKPPCIFQIGTVARSDSKPLASSLYILWSTNTY